MVAVFEAITRSDQGRAGCVVLRLLALLGVESLLAQDQHRVRFAQRL